MSDIISTPDILDFGVPEEKHSIIKVIGVGGGVSRRYSRCNLRSL